MIPRRAKRRGFGTPYPLCNATDAQTQGRVLRFVFVEEGVLLGEFIVHRHHVCVRSGNGMLTPRS